MFVVAYQRSVLASVHDACVHKKSARRCNAALERMYVSGGVYRRASPASQTVVLFALKILKILKKSLRIPHLDKTARKVTYPRTRPDR